MLLLSPATEQLSLKQKTQLQCWSLGQATYMLGGNQGVPSYVVGYGATPPTVVQQMASSCPAHPRSGDPPVPCNWDSAFFPGVPNPSLGLVSGALVWGPGNGTDGYAGSSRRSDDTRVRLEDNVGFTGMLAGLTSYGISIDTCFLGHGLWQRYVQIEGGI